MMYDIHFFYSDIMSVLQFVLIYLGVGSKPLGLP